MRSIPIDYDFTEVPEDQSSGWLEQSNEELLAAADEVPFFEEAFPQLMVPRSQWKDRCERVSAKLRATVQAIYSQGREGSCVGFGGGQAYETLAFRRFGKEAWISISGMSIYKRIGRTSQSGAYIPDGVDALVEGCLPVNSDVNKELYPHTHPRTGFNHRLPSGWQNTARNFRLTKWAKCRGIDEIYSALFNGATGIVGRQRHCVPYVAPAWIKGEVMAMYANSWSVGWGDHGFGYDSQRMVDSLVLYAFVDVAIPQHVSSDVDYPPVIAV